MEGCAAHVGRGHILNPRPNRYIHLGENRLFFVPRIPLTLTLSPKGRGHMRLFFHLRFRWFPALGAAEPQPRIDFSARAV